MRNFNAIFLILVSVFWGNVVTAQNIDIDILKSINPRNPASSYWKNTSNSAYWFAGAITAGQLVYGLSVKNDQVKNNAYQAFIATGEDYLVTELLKKVVNRTRPEHAYPQEIFVNSVSNDPSFPSGHTSLAFETATTISIEYHKWYVTVPAYLWAGTVGYSRLYLGKHYPTDVLAGAAIGVGSAYVSKWLNGVFNDNRHRHHH